MRAGPILALLGFSCAARAPAPSIVGQWHPSSLPPLGAGATGVGRMPALLQLSTPGGSETQKPEEGDAFGDKHRAEAELAQLYTRLDQYGRQSDTMRTTGRATSMMAVLLFWVVSTIKPLRMFGLFMLLISVMAAFYFWAFSPTPELGEMVANAKKGLHNAAPADAGVVEWCRNKFGELNTFEGQCQMWKTIEMIWRAFFVITAIGALLSLFDTKTGKSVSRTFLSTVDALDDRLRLFGVVPPPPDAPTNMRAAADSWLGQLAAKVKLSPPQRSASALATPHGSNATAASKLMAEAAPLPRPDVWDKVNSVADGAWIWLLMSILTLGLTMMFRG